MEYSLSIGDKEFNSFAEMESYIRFLKSDQQLEVYETRSYFYVCFPGHVNGQGERTIFEGMASEFSIDRCH